ncbi:D-alanyl-D-alanine carboxypeptidase/D-alanyl-D-alanine-endopeptidase [bacterium]|nr:D-alanyl-D-alanine carboxypeptidase/D-alanyl-D-alanine-endopeptidase [bacterium]
MKTLLTLLSLFLSLSLLAESCPFTSFNKNGGALIVQDATSNKVVISCGEPQKAYKYASTVKLLTTATALKLLGRDFKFTTKFLFSPQKKVLTIISSGDPSLVIEQLTIIAHELKQRGVSNIKQVRLLSPGWNGKIEREQQGAGRGDRAYQAPISALSLNFNTVTVSVTPAKQGEKPQISVGIPPDAFVIKNQAKSVKGGGKSLIVSTTATKNRTVITVSGTIGTNRAKPAISYRRIYHPAHHYIYTLLALMGNKMVPVEISAADIPLNEKHHTIYTHKSRPLHDILTDMNRYSNNFIAETLTATLGIKEGGDPKNGVTAIKELIKKEYSFEANIRNGSGLGNGEYNYITPLQIMTLLQRNWHDRWGAIDFFSTLPVYGETGTLHRVPHTASIGNIRAKTGTLSGISAAAGIFRGKNGKIYLFTIILSDKSVRRLTTKRNQILSKLVEMF